MMPCVIENHFSHTRKSPTPMDIEWAQDGTTRELFVVQARPETVHGHDVRTTLRVYHMTGEGEPLDAFGRVLDDGRAAYLDFGIMGELPGPHHSARARTTRSPTAGSCSRSRSRRSASAWAATT